MSSNSHRPEFLDRLADLVPPPRKHRHRYHGVFAPNHKLRRAVTALAIGNIGKRCDAAAGGHGGGGHATEGCCDANQKPRSHDTGRIAWAKLMARVGEEFPLECPACGGDIRLIAFRLLSECETIPGLRTLGNLRLLRTSCPRTGADPKDPHPFGRTTRTAAGVARTRPAHRLTPSLCKSMMNATSFRRRQTSCPQSTSTASDRCRTLGIDEAARRPDSERLRAHAGKPPPPRGKAGGPGKAWCGLGDRSTRLTSRSSVGRCSRKCH